MLANLQILSHTLEWGLILPFTACHVQLSRSLSSHNPVLHVSIRHLISRDSYSQSFAGAGPLHHGQQSAQQTPSKGVASALNAVGSPGSSAANSSQYSRSENRLE